MSNLKFYLKRGDLGKPLIADLPSDVDLTGASVVFNMWKKPSREVVISRGAATIVSNSSPARVQYQWQSGDTDNLSGTYEAEFEVKIGSIPKTYPNNTYITVEVEEDIA